MDWAGPGLSPSQLVGTLLEGNAATYGWMVLSVKSLHFQLLVKISETSASKTQTFPSNCPLLKNREA